MKRKRIIGAMLAVSAFFMNSVSPVIPLTAWAADGVTIDKTNFPDGTFRDYVSSNFDTNGNGVLEQSEIDGVTIIDVSGTEKEPNTVSDLKGVEHFSKLIYLNCRYNQLTSLDVSSNTALIYLYCSNNQLTSFDVSKNTELKWLQCSYNDIIDFDVSHNTALSYLELNFNQLTRLDVSKNTALEYLYCDSNQLSKLDVSNNAELMYLWCENNNLTSLDIRHNSLLIELYCSKNMLTSLDVMNNTELTNLSCGNNNLTSLDLSNNAALSVISCHNNKLTSLDVSKNIVLNNLWCYKNKLTSLDLSNNNELTLLSCGQNRLTSLDLSNNNALVYFYCQDSSYSIGNVSTYSLSNLPSFDPAKASDWSGAVYDSSTKSLKNITADTVTYKYDCGNGHTVTFTLKREGTSPEDVTVEDVNGMTMDEVISFVNSFASDLIEDTIVLTEAQLRAIELVLENDY